MSKAQGRCHDGGIQGEHRSEVRKEGGSGTDVGDEREESVRGRR